MTNLCCCCGKTEASEPNGMCKNCAENVTDFLRRLKKPAKLKFD